MLEHAHVDIEMKQLVLLGLLEDGLAAGTDSIYTLQVGDRVDVWVWGLGQWNI